MAIAWGDVSTAFHSTGIGDITVYQAMPRSLHLAARASGALASLADNAAAKKALSWAAGHVARGPDAESLARDHAEVWGEVGDDDGNRVQGALITPAGYRFTADSALRAATQVMTGTVAAGAWTPSRALSKEFVLAYEGVEVYASTRSARES